jgi:hypothetical protein
MSMKNSNDLIGNRTRDHPACSTVPQPTAPPPKFAGGGRSRRIFQGEKILSAPSFGRESKTVGPMSLIYDM